MTKARCWVRSAWLAPSCLWIMSPPRGRLSSSAQKLPPCHPAHSQSRPETSEEQQRADIRLEQRSLRSPYRKAISQGHRGWPTRAQASGQGANTQRRSSFSCLFASSGPPHLSPSEKLFPIPGRWYVALNQKCKSFLNFPKSKDRTEIWLVECCREISISSVRYFKSSVVPKAHLSPKATQEIFVKQNEVL